MLIELLQLEADTARSRQGAFDALQQMLLLPIIGYSLNSEACIATLVSGPQMISLVELSKGSLAKWFNGLAILPEKIYPDLSSNQQMHIKKVINAALKQYGLLDCQQLTADQKAQLYLF